MKKLLLAVLLIGAVQIHAGTAEKTARCVWHVAKILTGGYLSVEFYDKEFVMSYWQRLKDYYYGERVARGEEKRKELVGGASLLMLPGMAVLDGAYGLYNVFTEQDEQPLDTDF